MLDHTKLFPSSTIMDKTANQITAFVIERWYSLAYSFPSPPHPPLIYLIFPRVLLLSAVYLISIMWSTPAKTESSSKGRICDWKHRSLFIYAVFYDLLWTIDRLPE